MTEDAGSQMKATTRQIVEVPEANANGGKIYGNVASWVKMLDNFKRKYKTTKWRVAPTEAQNFNRLPEANVKVLKQLLKSQLQKPD